MNEWVCSYLIKNIYNHNIIKKKSNYPYYSNIINTINKNSSLNINKNNLSNIYNPNLGILNKKYYFNEINISNITQITNIPKSFLEEIE